MKKAKELLDLPIFSISGAKQVGIIKDLVIDPNDFSVEFFIVGQDDWQESVMALHYEKVFGFGEFAIIVEEDQPLIELNNIPFFYQKVNLKGSQVITTGGEFSGIILDFYFNEENGRLESLLLNSFNRELFLPIENVISLGKDLVIINDSLSDIIPSIEGEEQEDAPSSQGNEGNRNRKKEALRIMLGELIKNELSVENPISKKLEED